MLEVLLVVEFGSDVFCTSRGVSGWEVAFVLFVLVVHLGKSYVGGGVWAWRSGFSWVGNVEGVLEISCGMLLWDEEGVEVPEAGIDEAETY